MVARARACQRALAYTPPVSGSSAARLFLRAISAPALSRPAAWLADARLPRPLLRLWIAAWVQGYGVDLSEVADPLESFACFNEFFVRALRPGARPLDADPDALLSPSDSLLSARGLLPADGQLEQVKGRTYGLEQLLGSAEDAALFRAGVHATLYLSPAMYHRVHVPADGRIRRWRYLPGRLYPVNALAVRHVEALFAVNERVVVHLDSERFGPLAVVLVGATNVGRISLAVSPLRSNAGQPGGETRPPEPVPVARGDELGRFNLGSTVVLLAADPTLQPAEAAVGGFVRMGQALWRRGARRS